MRRAPRSWRRPVVSRTAVVACVGGGSNALGIFDAFVPDEGVRLIGVEAGGDALRPRRHAARFASGSAGVLQGTRTIVLQDEAGNIEPTHPISAGLDYPAVGPEHAWLRDLERTEYTWVTDDQAVEAFLRLSRLEGILPALESAHAVAAACILAQEIGPDHVDPRQPVRTWRQGHGEHTMSRLNATFDRLRQQGRSGLVTYVTAGDPSLERSGEILVALEMRRGQRARDRRPLL